MTARCRPVGCVGKVEQTEFGLAVHTLGIIHKLYIFLQSFYTMILKETYHGCGHIATRVHLLVRTPAVGYVIILSLEEVLQVANHI